MRKLLAGLITAAVLGLMVRSALVGTGEGRGEAGETTAGAAPAVERPVEVVAIAPGRVGADPIVDAEERVRELLASARDGDLDGYLDAFDGDLRARLEREVVEQGPGAFARRLREAAGARKSHAVFAPEPEGDDGARVTVESVYPDRNERQAFRLSRSSGRWLVVGVETVQARRPEARFGSPATFQAPEAPPVMAGPEGGSDLDPTLGQDDPR